MPMRRIFGNRHSEDLYYELCESADPRVRLYVYRWINEEAIKPAIYNGYPFPDLNYYLQSEFNGGEFKVMFRRGETMLLSGLVAIYPYTSRKQSQFPFRHRAEWED